MHKFQISDTRKLAMEIHLNFMIIICKLLAGGGQSVLFYPVSLF